MIYSTFFSSLPNSLMGDGGRENDKLRGDFYFYFGGKISLVTLCDLSKAFDSVHHEILVQKLTKVNINPFWFRDYLHNRTQAVKINNTMSDIRKLAFGVPQGSILGPILFTIFINDLTDTINECEVIQYADDTQFLHSGTLDTLPHLITQAQATLTRAKSYFSTNGLMLNPQKTQCMFVGTRPLISRIPENTIITLDNTSIIPKKHVKNLGIYMDCNMSFDTHINELYKKAMGILLFLNRVKDKLEPDTRKMVVQALVLSVINYCLPVYGTTNDTLLHRVQKLQNFAAKICADGARRSDHATPFITQLQWLTVNKQIIFDVAVNVFRVTNKVYPEWFLKLPTVNDTVHNRNTRQRNKLHVPHTNTYSGRRSLTVLGPRVWNSLPTHITQSHTLPVFKKRLKTFLNSDNNYCVNFR